MVYKYRIHVNDFNLTYTLDCGQTFRWYKDCDEWIGILPDRVMKVQQKTDILYVTTNQPWMEEKILEYFGLKDNLNEVREVSLENLGDQPQVYEFVKHAFGYSWGLRILRQDPLEVFVSYIFSIQSNIPAIRSRLEKLCELFPENVVRFEGKRFFIFPGLKQLKSLNYEDWQKLKLGFRAKWVHNFIQKIDENYLKNLKKLDLKEKLERLTKLEGVGYKVASCVALFGYGELNAFPVDRWIIRIMEGFEVHGTPKKIMQVGMEWFSPYAGYVQEYLFRIARNRGKWVMN